MVKIWIYFSHVIWNRTACKLLAWPPVQALNRSLHHFKTCITWKKTMMLFIPHPHRPSNPSN